jgi:hypothetical protein
MSEIIEELDVIIRLLPLLIPLILIQLGLNLFVIIDIIRKKQTKTLSPAAWVAIALLINMIGAILYIIFGRSDTIGNDEDF